MFDDKNLQKDDALAKRLEHLSSQVKPSPALMKAAKTGVPLRVTGIRYTAGMHIRKFSKAVLLYAACVALLLGGVFLLPKLFGEGGPVATQPSQTTTTEPAPTECEHKYMDQLPLGGHPCTDDWSYTSVCKYCKHRVYHDIPAPGHDFVDGVCTRCGETEEFPPDVTCVHDQDPASCPYCLCDEHVWISSENTPTCTEGGKIVHTCIKCGYSYEEWRDAVDHEYIDGVCTICGFKCQHVYADHFYNGNICTICGTECKHNYTENTCDAVCTLCGKRQGHDYEEIISTEHICTEGTVTTTSCRRCGYGNVAITPAKGHSYQNGTCIVCEEVKKAVTVTDSKVTAGSVSLLPGQMVQTYPNLSGEGFTWVDPTMTPYYYNVYTYFGGYTVTDIRVPVYRAEKGSVLTIGVARVENGIITDRIAFYELTADRAMSGEWALFSGLSIEVPEGCTLTFGWMSDTLWYTSPVSGHIPGYSQQDDYSGLGSQIPLIFDVYGKKN